MTQPEPADDFTRPQPTFRPAIPAQPVPVQPVPIKPVPIKPVPIKTARASASNDEGPLLTDVAELRAGWQQIKARFVEDPHGSVAEAADVVAEAADKLAAALRASQQRIRDTWDADVLGRDTEVLRVALLRYQALFNHMTGE
jgi:hypothetical protein